MPDCQTGKVCPANEDLASDIDITNFIDEFIKIKLLYDYNQINSIAESGYESLDLLKHPDELLKLEKFFIEYKKKIQQIKKDEEEFKNGKGKWNRIL